MADDLLKIMFDTKIFGLLEKKMNDLIALKSRNVEYLITNIQVNEIAAIKDDERDKRQKIFRNIILLQPRLVSARDGTWGQSKWGFLTWSKHEEERMISEVQQVEKSINSSEDSLIGITALKNADIFISNDEERNMFLEKIIRAKGLKAEIMNFDAFNKWLIKQSS